MVLSWSPYAIHLFRRSDGGLVERHPLNTPVESVVPGSGGLWSSGAHQATSSAIRRLKLGESEARPVLRLPDAYTAGGPVGGIFGEMPFAMWADTLLVGFMPLPYLIVADTTGRELDRFELPAARRKGGTADPAAAIDEVLAGGRPYSEVFGLFSVTRGVHRRPDGTTLVVHFDMGTEIGPVSTAGLWVSVIDASRESACVDAAIPLEPGSRAAIGFERDLVLVLEVPPPRREAMLDTGFGCVVSSGILLAVSQVEQEQRHQTLEAGSTVGEPVFTNSGNSAGARFRGGCRPLPPMPRSARNGSGRALRRGSPCPCRARRGGGSRRSGDPVPSSSPPP